MQPENLTKNYLVVVGKLGKIHVYILTIALIKLKGSEVICGLQNYSNLSF